MAEELGINKDYALRLVKSHGELLGISPHVGQRNAVYLSRADADKLIADYEPRRARVPTTGQPASIDGYGFFYIFQLHPEDLPRRHKLGYTDKIEVRSTDHRTIAPTLKLIASWPCLRTWERAAIDSVTRDSCEKISREVFDGDQQVFVQRARAFFAIMPQPSVNDRRARKPS